MRIYNDPGRKQYTFDELIELAKKKVESVYGGDSREWIEAFADSYGTSYHRLRILVWEGSPVKGYVVVNYGTQMIRAYGVNDRLLKEYDAQGIIMGLRNA